MQLADLRSTNSGSYLRVDFTDDDFVLNGLISQCRVIAEQVTSLAFAPQTLRLNRQPFKGSFKLVGNLAKSFSNSGVGQQLGPRPLDLSFGVCGSGQLLSISLLGGVKRKSALFTLST